MASIISRRRLPTLAATLFLCHLAAANALAQNRAAARSGVDFDRSDFVVYGAVAKSHVDPKGFPVVDVAVIEVFKGHPSIKDLNTIRVRQEYEVGKVVILFCKVDGQVNMPVESLSTVRGSALVQFLRGMSSCNSRAECLEYCLDHLESGDPDVAARARREFDVPSARELLAEAKSLSPVKLADRLRNVRTLEAQYSALLLGGCGSAEHGKLLRARIVESVRKEDADLSGFLKGCVLLQPKEGWAYLHGLLLDSSQPWKLRKSAFDAAVFLFEGTDLVDRKELTRGMAALLDQRDHLAYECIVFFTRHKVWDRTNQVLDLYDRQPKAGFSVNSAVIDFAMDSPEPRARAFLDELSTGRALVPEPASKSPEPK